MCVPRVRVCCVAIVMGYLVEGVGDEVLLFGAFLGFSACVTVLVNFLRERTNRERQEQSSQSSSKELEATSATLSKLCASILVYIELLVYGKERSAYLHGLCL